MWELECDGKVMYTRNKNFMDEWKREFIRWILYYNGEKTGEDWLAPVCLLMDNCLTNCTPPGAEV